MHNPCHHQDADSGERTSRQFLPTLSSVFFSTLVAVSGCPPEADYSVGSYQSALASGLKQIPVACQMMEKFPETDHMIIMYGNDSQGSRREWHTVSYFGGRYELTYVISVTLSEDGRTIVDRGNNGLFKLLAMDSVEEGVRAAHYDSDRQRGFLVDVWEEFCQTHDLSVLDPTYDGQAVERSDEFVETMRRPRMIWKSVPRE